MELTNINIPPEERHDPFHASSLLSMSICQLNLLRRFGLRGKSNKKKILQVEILG